MEATHKPGKPSQRRYSPEEKAAAVRMVRTLRKELGTKNGTAKLVADQLGYGAESVRTWVKQAEIDDGHVPGVSTDEVKRLKELEQEVRELRRANEILKRAASFFGARARAANTSDRGVHRRYACTRVCSRVDLPGPAGTGPTDRCTH